MAETRGTRPNSDWAQFLEAAPNFLEAIAPDADTDLYGDFDPVVRAVLYFDLFDGQVANGGVAQYYLNKGCSLREFDRAPDFVAANPVLADAVPFLRQAHAFWVEARTDLAATLSRPGGVVAEDDALRVAERACALFEAQAGGTGAFEARFFQVHDEIRMRVNRAILETPHAYLDIPAPPGLTGRGIETAEMDGAYGRWRLRFVDGFPIGPNLCQDAGAPGGLRLLRFTDDRMHLECDDWSSDPQDFRRLWVDYRAGVYSERAFRAGRLNGVQGRRWLGPAHGLSEDYGPDGAVRHTSLSIDGARVIEEYFDDNGGRRLVVQRDPDGREVWRCFHVDGRLNTEAMLTADLRKRYLRCLDPSGADLAPGGTGVFQEYSGVFEGRMRWLTGTLVDGFLDGDVVRTDNGEVTAVERFEKGFRRDA